MKENVESTLINCALEMFHFQAMVNIFYVKLQDAYVSEKGDKFGSWKIIGYNMYNNSNFDYYESGTKVGSKGVNESAAESTSLPDAETIVWGASNIAALNDCSVTDGASGAGWQLMLKKNADNGSSVVYKATGAANCLLLTPSFEKLTTTN